MKKSYIIVILIGFIFLIAAVTNPNQESHREAIKKKLNLHLQNVMKENISEGNNIFEQAGQALGSMFGGAFIDGMVANMVNSNNYVIFSTTEVTWEGESRVIGIGAFGNVFITKKLDEAIEEGFLKNKF